MGRLFGTDGVRGVANADLSPELALSLSVAAAHVLADAHLGHRPVAVVGRDTRASGEMLEAAVVAGLTSAGADVVRLGVVPTPGVAFLVGAMGADLGVMLSASHNPMPDNGLKFFSRDGVKLADEVEDQIEARSNEAWSRPTGAAIGRVHDDTDAVDSYIAHLVGTVAKPLAGLHVVIDCAHGAASLVGPVAYEAAGAQVTALHAEPDGLNINDECGATHPAVLQQVVRDLGADVGLAHDGDADRCIAVDGNGELVDGDAILAICALSLHEASRLEKDTVVTTVMTNLGFRHAMDAAGVHVIETPVGDRYVLQAMLDGGYGLGGEQSGHVIFREFATTGDGVLTGLQLLSRLAATGRSLADLAAVMHRLPQVLLNVQADRARAEAPAVKDAVAAAEQRLGDTGRVLVRPSGTEPVVRVMVEAPTDDEAHAVAEEIAAAVRG